MKWITSFLLVLAIVIPANAQSYEEERSAIIRRINQIENKIDKIIEEQNILWDIATKQTIAGLTMKEDLIKMDINIQKLAVAIRYILDFIPE